MATKKKKGPISTPGLTVVGEPNGTNCVLSIAGYGARSIRVLTVGYNVSITSNEENNATYTVFYPINVLADDFTLVAIFPSYRSRESFTAWVQGYMLRASTNAKSASGYVNVSVPVRKFYRKAVLSGTLEFGMSSGDIAFPLTLTFIGSADPLNLNKASGYVAPKNKDAAADAAFSYPSTSTQLKGMESYEGTIFDELITRDQAYADWQHMMMSGIATYISFEDYYAQVSGGSL